MPVQWARGSQDAARLPRGGRGAPTATGNPQQGQPGSRAPVLPGAGVGDAPGRSSRPCVCPACLSFPSGAEGHRRRPAEPDRQEHLRLPGEDLPPDHPPGVSARDGDTTGKTGQGFGTSCQGGTQGTKPSQGWRQQGHCRVRGGLAAGQAGAALTSPQTISPPPISFRLRNKKWVNEQR